MVPSIRGKRWTIPDNSEEAIAGDAPRASHLNFQLKTKTGTLLMPIECASVA
jgi:hypothetical protein